MSRKVIKIGCGRLCDNEGEIYSHWRPCSKCRLRNNEDDCKYYRHLMDVTATTIVIEE